MEYLCLPNAICVYACAYYKPFTLWQIGLSITVDGCIIEFNIKPCKSLSLAGLVYELLVVSLNWVASLGLLGLRKIPLQARGLKVLECNPRRDCRTKKRANTQKSSIRLIDIDNWWQSIGGSGCALKLMETFRTGATLWQQTLNSSCHSAA